MVATGDYSLEEVRRTMQRKGLKGKKSNFPDLLRNPVYIGKLRIINEEGKVEGLIDAIHEPIISEELFYAVQDILEDKKKRKNIAKIRTPKTELPLRGFLVCPKCGKKLTGSASKGNGGRYYYYHCDSGCGERYRASELNEQFIYYLSGFAFNRHIKDIYSAILKDTLDENEHVQKKDTKAIDAEIQRLEERINNLQDKLADDLISISDYSSAKMRYDAKMRELKSQKIDANILSKEVNEQLTTSFSFLEDLPFRYRNSTLDVQQRIIGSIFPENLTFSEKRFRTNRINEVVRLFCLNTNEMSRNKNGQFRSVSELSDKVGPPGLEPGTLRL